MFPEISKIPVTDAHQRLVALHRLLDSEMERNANDNAILILKEIATETKGAKLTPTPDAPSADPCVRLQYWQQLYARACRFRQFDMTIEMLREIRKESARCQ